MSEHTNPKTETWPKTETYPDSGLSTLLGIIAVIGIVAYDGYLTSSGKKIAEYEKARMVNDSQEAAMITCLTDCISIEN